MLKIDFRRAAYARGVRPIPLTVLQAHLTTIHEQRVAGKEVDLGEIVDAMAETH
jgi:hypothetical protein